MYTLVPSERTLKNSEDNVLTVGAVESVRFDAYERHMYREQEQKFGIFNYPMYVKHKQQEFRRMELPKCSMLYPLREAQELAKNFKGWSPEDVENIKDDDRTFDIDSPNGQTYVGFFDEVLQ